MLDTAAGNSIRTWVPRPGSLRIRMDPPCSSMIRLHWYNPNPKPFDLLLLKGWNSV